MLASIIQALVITREITQIILSTWDLKVISSVVLKQILGDIINHRFHNSIYRLYSFNQVKTLEKMETISVSFRISTAITSNSKMLQTVINSLAKKI